MIIAKTVRGRMTKITVAVLWLALSAVAPADDEEHHSHPTPEKLGFVTFPTSCKPPLAPQFERALALLHSFAYTAAEKAFRAVADQDAGCAIAHWGIAMSLFHQLWDPPAGEALKEAAAQVQLAIDLQAGSLRERRFIQALDQYYRDAASLDHAHRAAKYAQSMAGVARDNPGDPEAQIFYALALIATAPATDKTHANQKLAAGILEPIFLRQPQHPGLAHYLIHAYDSAELSPRGLAAARAYARIAPSAPHALHMPSHIFTRLGRWDDSIASNLAARAAAHEHGDLGEELHAMDYLTYAYLQRGRFDDAERIVGELRSMKDLPALDFKVGYAATAMPVRLAIERQLWTAAASLEPLPRSAPHVRAFVFWAQALGHSRGTTVRTAQVEIDKLRECLIESQSGGNKYWTTQVDALVKEADAWSFAASGAVDEAIRSMRAAADEEDAVEKLPVTPGPIVPAREQLGDLLLQLKRPDQALREYQAALALAPGRRGALRGGLMAAEQSGNTQAAQQLRLQLAE